MKKSNNLEDLGGFVFSTNNQFIDQINTDEDNEVLEPHQQQLEAHLDKKNRGGKLVTIIKGFKGSNDDLKTLAKQLKTLCGVGGSSKNSEILIQGNFRDKIIAFLKKEGYKVKRVGS